MMNFRNDRYVVVDLEATSTGSKAKIIQVGIVVIENGEIVDQFATDVNPHEPLDTHIKELTGLTDQRLAEAPEFSQVAGKIFALVKDGVFVAHNVQFDANLLAEFLSFSKAMNCALPVSIQWSWPRYFILSLKNIIWEFSVKSWEFL